jgi:hypothetical protein
MCACCERVYADKAWMGELRVCEAEAVSAIAAEEEEGWLGKGDSVELSMSKRY